MKICRHCGESIWLAAPEIKRWSLAYAYRSKSGNICPKDGYWHLP